MMENSKSILLLERIGWWTSIVGIAGILFVMASFDANAQTPPANGFEGGARPFNNPYAPPADGGMEPSFTGEVPEEEFIFPSDDEGGAPVTGGAFPGSGAQPPQGGGSGGISVGGPGSKQGQIISKGNVKALKVDSETAEGCKDIVTDFNFPDADIMDIAKTLGRLLGKNFILDSKDIKGRISIISNGPISCGDAWKAFLTALDVNGYALIPSGAFIRISRQRDARDKQLKTFTGDFTPDTDALVTKVFSLKYLSAEEVARNFRSFMPPNARMVPYEQTNSVIVTDTGSNLVKMSRLLEILDIEGFDAGIEVIPVQHASASELAKLIDSLIPGSAAPGGAPGAPRFGPQAGRFSARRTKEGGIINNVIADDRTNKLIIHANARGVGQVRELVNKLDQKVAATTGGGKVHVVYLQFADAEQIANTLNNISQTAGRPATPPPGGGVGVNPVQQALFEGNIRISPDKATNSLVVTASPSDFATIQRVVNRLDIPRDQVYAEAVIMEIQMGRAFNFSSNIISPKTGIGLITSDKDILSFAASPFASKGAIIPFKAGGSTTMKIGDKDVTVGNITALIKAIQTNSNANILATPQILTLDNTEATFETTEKIPVPTTTAVQGAGVTSGITKEPVSLSLSIKPQINKISNFVKLDINAKMGDIAKRELPANVKDSAFATIERSAKTSVVVADSDTVVLGGLTRDNRQDIVSKIPLLGDIPLLGWLFRSKESEVTKSNLLIFITPRIIRQYESIRAVLDKKLKERDEFIETNAGGEDPMRKARDAMIRDLPDLKETLNRPIEKSVTVESGIEAEETAPPAAQPETAPLSVPDDSGTGG